MTPLQERLSQLWSEELPEPEARALRERIATEPEVAAQWERLCGAMEALADLPDALPPPPLRAAVPPRSPAWRAAPWLLAAAAALLWLIPKGGAPEIVLVDGSQWVEGDVHLLAGDVPIDVDGKVWISVEPADGVPRVGVPNVEDPMNKSTLVAGLAGAIVTVVVYEGTAVVRAQSGVDGVVVEAGETHHVEGRAASKSGPPKSPQERQENIARLQGELANVQQALAEAEFEGALTRGQLVAMQGKPSPWPADVPPEIGPERFRAELEARVAAVPDARVAEVDCAEYPCVAAIQFIGTEPGDDWNKPMADSVRGWLDGVMDEVSISVNTSKFANDDREERYVIFGAHEEGRDSEVGTRTEFRIDAMIDELGERMKDPPPPGQ